VNFLDILALVVLAYGAYKGFRNGVVIEVAGLIGLIIGFWAGMRLAFLFAGYYRDNFQFPEKWVPAIAFFTAFAIGLGAVYLAGWAATKLLNAAQLDLPNRLAGLGFGVLKWGFLLGAFFSIIGNAQILPKETVEGSAAYPVATGYSKIVQGYTIGLIPQASNVLRDMEHYFVSLDSTRKSHGGPEADSTPVAVPSR
jgi:membrane protein required for colicin V production